MNWYYLDAKKTQIGPINDPEIQNLVSSGALNKTSLVWNETLTEWTSVEETPLATLCAPSMPRFDPTVNAKCTPGIAPPFAQGRVLNKASVLIKALWDKTRAAAHLSQKQALQQKLRMVDLKQADYNIGCKAFENKIAYNDYESLYLQIEEIKKRIEKLNTKTSEPTVTLTEKAKAAAIGAAKAAEIGTQTINEKTALINLGRKLRENPGTYPSLTQEIGIANGCIESMSLLEKEIQTLSTRSFTFARYSWLILTIFSVLGIGLAVYIAKVSRVSSYNESGLFASLSERAKHFMGESNIQIAQPTSHAVDYEVVNINKNVSTSGNTNKYDGFVTIKTHPKSDVFIVYDISTHNVTSPAEAGNLSALLGVIVYRNVEFDPSEKTKGISFFPDGYRQSTTYDDSAVLHSGRYDLFNNVSPKFIEWCNHAREINLDEDFSKDLTNLISAKLRSRARFSWKEGKGRMSIDEESSAGNSDILPEWSVKEFQYALSVFPSVAEALKNSDIDGNEIYRKEAEQKRKLYDSFKSDSTEKQVMPQTDAEKTESGLFMIRTAGTAKGGEFAQNYGRPPTEAEFDAILANAGITQEAIDRGTAETIELNKKIADEFRHGFEDGCNAVLGAAR